MKVVGSTINYGFGTIGGVMGGAFSAVTGFIKAEDAAESFASKFQHHINAKKDRVKTTFAMMREGLSRSYSEQEVDFIINNITKFDNGKFGLQINYNNCSSYQEKRYFDKSLNIYEMSELKKNATSSVCERIAKVMQQAQNNQELAAFEKNLKDIMLSPIRKLYGDAAKPLVSLGFNELISLAINKFNKPKADNDNEEQKSEEKAQEEEAEKITKQEKEEKENFDIAKKIQEDAEKAREQTETIVSDHEKRMAEKTNSCNSGKGGCYGERFGPKMPKNIQANTKLDLDFLDKLVAANSAYNNIRDDINKEFQKNDIVNYKILEVFPEKFGAQANLIEITDNTGKKLLFYNIAGTAP